MNWTSPEGIFAALIGTGAVGVAGRMLLTFLTKQGTIVASESAQKELLNGLTAEAHKWQALHEEERLNHKNTQDMLTMLQIQNAMLRLLLKQHGVPAEAIDEIERLYAPKAEAKNGD